MYNPTATQRDSAAYSKSPLLATALAALLGGMLGFSSIASAMEFSVYGSLRTGVNQTDTDDADDPDTRTVGNDVVNPTAGDAAANVDKSTGTLDTGVNNGGLSRFGVKGSEDLGNGMSAGFHFERGLYTSAEEHEHEGGAGEAEEVNHNLALRHENVWIKGDWGKLTIGQQGNPYRAAANWDQSWLLGGQNRYNDGGSRLSGVRYDSADLGPVRFSLMATADGSEGAETAAGTPFKVNAANAAAADDTNFYTVTKAATKDEDGIDRMIAAIHYDIGDIATVNLGFQTNAEESGDPGVSYDNFVISANGVAGPLSWYVALEDNSDNYEEHDVVGSGTCVAGTAGCEAGDNYVAERYAAQDADTIGVFLGFNASDNDLLYLEYEDSGVDGADAHLGSLDQEAILLGYTHAFGPHATFLVEYVTVDKASDYAADSSTLWAGLKVDF